MAMGWPLTYHLNNDTPLRGWFESRLPHGDRIAGDVPQRLRTLVPRGRPDTLPPWLIGMSFDWRLRLGIEVPEKPSLTTAHAGWGRMFPAEAQVYDPRMRGPVPELLDHARLHGAGRGGRAPRDEMELARISVALARYEAVYRGGPAGQEVLLELGPHPDVAALTSLCPRPAADELVRLTTAARRGLAPLFPASVIETNPVFDAHGIPADGDLVFDGMLLDVKTVGRPRIDRRWLWQLMGYVLLDRSQRDLNSVGIYLSRHAWLGRWEVDELISRLAGMELTIGELRDDFENFLTTGATVGSPL